MDKFVNPLSEVFVLY